MEAPAKRWRVFYAYPSNPPSAVDAARTAVDDLEHANVVEVLPWEKLFINGRLIPAEVFAAIDRADILIGDLTLLNANVLYEVGYAIGRGKKIWLTADLSRTTREAIAANVPPLATVGAHGYNNGHHIASAFESDLLQVVDTPPLMEQFRGVVSAPHTPSILLLKSLFETDAAIRVGDRVAKGPLPVVVDDPGETNARSMAWYVEKLLTAAGVAVHFTASDRTGAGPVNARYALVSGMARGVEANHLLLQEKSTTAVPLDFREDVRAYTTGREAARNVDEWLSLIEADQQQLLLKISEDAERAAQQATLQGLHMGMGDFVAENDRNLVSQYFLPTAPYLDALSSTSPVLFVGRKGTGKTANFLKLLSELRRSVNNLVCEVKPAGYDIASLVGAFRDVATDPAREGAMVALWKFLLLTEIAAELGRDYERRLDARLPVSEEEGALWELADREGWMESSFAERLEHVVTSDQPVAEVVATIYKDKVNPVVPLVAACLREKNRVCVLLDNLDKAWTREAEFPLLARFLLSLLVAGGELHNLLMKKLGHRVDLSTVVFVRSDIFEFVKRVAREPDKLPATAMRWSDRELLMRVVDERLRAVSLMPAPETWRRFFPSDVAGVIPREYIVDRILPRPRDVIVFVKAAIASAVNRGHAAVTVEDILQAEIDYSGYALDSVKVENTPVAAKLDEVFFQMFGEHVVLTQTDLDAIFDRSEIPQEERGEWTDLMVASSILGRETEDGRYEYSEDLASARMLALKARRYGDRRRLGSRFEIHTAFRKVLEIVD